MTDCMTDEERKLICAVLRQVGGYWYRHPDGSTRNCGKEAADEIERLATENEKLRNKLLEYVAESNTEFFFDSFPEKRT